MEESRDLKRHKSGENQHIEKVTPPTPPLDNTTTISDKTIAGEYEILDELGTGAFSIVYRAKNRVSGELVAAKIINFANMKQSDRPRQEKILANEIKIMNRIVENCGDNEHLIQIKGVIREPHRLAIIMELLDGGELFDRIIQKQRYTERDAAVLMNKIMSAIQTLHREGIVHRDLKPENLVFASNDEDAYVKITDFGLAQVMSWPDVHQTVVGTPNYVAPEVVSVNPRGPFYGPPCDIWSMGVILYILLVGYPPFYHDNVRELFKQIRRGDYEFHKDQWANISKEAKELVSKMLTVDPKKRITCDEVLAHSWMRHAPSDPLAGTVLQLKKLAAKRRFKAAAMAVVWGAQLGLRRKLIHLVDSHEARVFTMDELQRIRASFQQHSSDGTMDRVAFHGTLKQLGFENLPIDRMFDLFDRNGDGTLDYKEFLGNLATLRESGEDALKLCFQVYDEKNTGFISKVDIAKVLKTMLNVDSSTLSAKLESIFQRLDQNGDGNISYDEFKAGIFSEPVLVQAFLAPMDSIGTIPIENFVSTQMQRGFIDSKYL